MKKLLLLIAITIPLFIYISIVLVGVFFYTFSEVLFKTADAIENQLKNI